MRPHPSEATSLSSLPAIDNETPYAFPVALPSAGIDELPTDLGPLCVHRKDAFITGALRKSGTWEPDEGQFLRSTLRPGDTHVDVGANIGYMTLLGGTSRSRGGCSHGRSRGKY